MGLLLVAGIVKIYRNRLEKDGTQSQLLISKFHKFESLFKVFPSQGSSLSNNNSSSNPHSFNQKSRNNQISNPNSKLIQDNTEKCLITTLNILIKKNLHKNRPVLAENLMKNCNFYESKGPSWQKDDDFSPIIDSNSLLCNFQLMRLLGELHFFEERVFVGFEVLF